MRITNIGIKWAGFLVELRMWLEGRVRVGLVEYLCRVKAREDRRRRENGMYKDEGFRALSLSVCRSRCLPESYIGKSET